MINLGAVKQLAISVGLYKPARALRTALSPLQRRNFREHRTLLSQFVRPGDLTFDVGANVGTRSEILLSLGATVVAFEPQPLCAREISARRNGRLIVVNKAVGAREGTAQLHLNSKSAVASLVPNWDENKSGQLGTITVPVTTLDKAIEDFGVPIFCKIDVEGFEADVLKGLSSTIQTLSIEYHLGERNIMAIFECIDMLSLRGDYLVNLTGKEEALFLLPQWLTIKEFKKSFPACAKGNYWGDVLFRLERIGISKLIPRLAN